MLQDGEEEEEEEGDELDEAQENKVNGIVREYLSEFLPISAASLLLLGLSSVLGSFAVPGGANLYHHARPCHSQRCASGC